MTLKYFILSIFILLTSDVISQKRNNIWCFGDSAGIDFNGPTPVTFKTSVRSRGSCVSIADTSGSLLFYAHTSYIPLWMQGYTKLTAIWNSGNQLMQNGDSIVGNGWYKELIIIPKPTSDSEFYLFTAGVTAIHGFYYSLINMSFNNGLGKVVQKNVQLQGTSFLANDGLAAVKHGNGRDWWVIVRNWSNSNNKYYFYLVTPAGVALHHTENIGDSLLAGFFRIEPSKSGEKIACLSNRGMTAIYDFDRCSGYLSNELLIEHDESNANLFPWYDDCVFSLNENLLYVSKVASSSTDTMNYVFQYHLNDINPKLTRDTLFSLGPPVLGGLLELAPDNKVYFSCWYVPGAAFYYPYPDSAWNQYNMNLSVINYPDSMGTACDFQPFSFYLGGSRTYSGLPNNPNYELKADSGSMCDTLTVGVAHNEFSNLNTEMFVFYHPDWQTVFINAQKLKGKKAILAIYNITGQQVLKTEMKVTDGYLTYDFHTNGLAEGMYLVSIQTEREKLTVKFIKN